MSDMDAIKISLLSLANGTPNISSGFGASLAEAGAVCFNDQNHESGSTLKIEGVFNGEALVTWQPVTDEMKRTWHDMEVAAENGAYGVAILLIKELTDYEVVQRSRKGTGFDYWLGSKNDTLFQSMAKLEVSGILSGDMSRINDRKNVKLKQVAKTRNELDSYVIIVEFGSPAAHMVTINGC